jgi:two-component system LytT family response regulator
MRKPIDLLRVLIVDDEAPARYLIRHLLASEPDLQIVGEAENARQAVEMIQSKKVDLIFLDIQLRGKGAFSIVQEIGADQMPLVIFITAHREHALDAFQLSAVDYLLKPVDPERFYLSVSRARERLTNRNISSMKSMISSLLPATEVNSRERIRVHNGNKWIVINLKEIVWLKAERNYIRAFSKDSNYKIRRSISAIERQLPEQFLRIHRSTIVNVDFVREFIRLFHGEYRLILEDGTQLHVSRKYRPQLQEKLHSI